MSDLPPITPAGTRTSGGLVRRAGNHPAPDATSDAPHHVVPSFGAGPPTIPRPPSSAPHYPNQHPQLVVSTTTTLYTPAMGRSGITSQDPGSPTRGRIFDIPVANLTPIAESTLKQPISFPKGYGGLQKYRPAPTSEPFETAHPQHYEGPNPPRQHASTLKHVEKNFGHRAPSPAVPSINQPPPPRSKTPNDRQPPTGPDNRLAIPPAPAKKLDDDASRVETFADIRAASPLTVIGGRKGVTVAKPPGPAAKTVSTLVKFGSNQQGHFVNRLSGTPPSLNLAAIWKRAVEEVASDDHVYTLAEVGRLRVGLDDSMNKMLSLVHVASETHQELKNTIGTTLGERKRKTILYDEETARRKETASTMASYQVRKKAKYA
ncbi:hypothetical protein Q8F55_005348 [Vanrija albida]|uniref:Uncharacterized protein n=1 Tax=Vanrija albida TaxID=181172 RepID=A0ABR3Q1E0_9TREE